jgi:hypothetical protein
MFYVSEEKEERQNEAVVVVRKIYNLFLGTAGWETEILNKAKE